MELKKVMRSVEILLSCMNEEDYSIISGSNIKTNTVIINQCSENSMNQININNNKYVKWINSTERGLSKSRNMAIHNSCADICLIADNDEKFDELKVKACYGQDALPRAYRSLSQKDCLNIYKMCL